MPSNSCQNSTLEFPNAKKAFGKFEFGAFQKLIQSILSNWFLEFVLSNKKNCEIQGTKSDKCLRSSDSLKIHSEILSSNRPNQSTRGFSFALAFPQSKMQDHGTYHKKKKGKKGKDHISFLPLLSVIIPFHLLYKEIALVVFHRPTQKIGKHHLVGWNQCLFHSVHA